jgi:hypothetical protein
VMGTDAFGMTHFQRGRVNETDPCARPIPALQVREHRDLHASNQRHKALITHQMRKFAPLLAFSPFRNKGAQRGMHHCAAARKKMLGDARLSSNKGSSAFSTARITGIWIPCCFEGRGKRSFKRSEMDSVVFLADEPGRKNSMESRYPE